VPTLVFLAGNRAGESIPVVTEPFTVGRSPECDLIIDDLSISGVHAKLRCERNIWSIRDMGTANGTTLNGSPTALAIVRPGDRIGVGDIQFRFDSAPPLNSVDHKHSKDQTKLVILDSTMIEEGDIEVDAFEYMEKHRAELHCGMVPYLIGDNRMVDLLLIATLCRGHAILSGPTGIGRLRSAQAYADLLGLPTLELHGADALHPDTEGVVVARGLDDMSRTTMTQLFSSMRQNQTEPNHPLLVLGIHNDGESIRLSPGQLNLFLMNIQLSYPTSEQEQNMIAGLTEEDLLEVVLPFDQVRQLRNVLETIPFPAELLETVVSAIRRTRPDHPDAPDVVRELLHAGAGPSAGRHLLNAARAHAFIHGRRLVLRLDVRAVLEPVLGHRLQFNEGAGSPDPVFDYILELLEPTSD